MIRRFTPGLITATVFVVVLGVVFVWLGVWQLSRLEEKRLENDLVQQRFNSPAGDMQTLASAHDPVQIEYRRATAAGEYDVANEVLIRSQVYRGQAGFHVVTPLIRENGTAVLVNRGWVPLSMDTVPVVGATPRLLADRVEGWVHLTETKPFLGPDDPADGRLATMSRVDIQRIQRQVPYQLDPVYLIRIDENGQLPEPIEVPAFDDEGPHLAYGIQWFGFAVILVVGFGFLVRRRLTNSTTSSSS